MWGGMLISIGCARRNPKYAVDFWTSVDVKQGLVAIIFSMVTRSAVLLTYRKCSVNISHKLHKQEATQRRPLQSQICVLLQSPNLPRVQRLDS